jgi:hypothetical protein
MPPTRKLTNEESLNLIDCVGVDNKRHQMISWEDKCLCGMAIKHKRAITNGKMNFDCNCYECDSINDGSYWGE